jgi:DNA-binding transcriptional ArsR family regulator
MGTKQPKTPPLLDKRIYRLQAQIAKALAHPLRLEILNCLGDGEVLFGKLQGEVNVSKANLSQHLAIMRRAGIVIDRREGNTTVYRLAYPEIRNTCRCLAEVLHRHLSSGAKLAMASRAIKR